MKELGNRYVVATLLTAWMSFGLAAPAQAEDISEYLTGEIAHLVPVSRDVNVHDFSVVAADATGGRRVEKLANHKGKVLLVTFWAENCIACRLHLKDLAAAQQEIGTDTVEVIAINQDGFPHARAAKTLARWGIHTLAAYQDYHNDVALRLKGNPAIRLFGNRPKTLVIDPDGQVRAIANMRKNWTAPEVRTFIEALEEGRI